MSFQFEPIRVICKFTRQSCLPIGLCPESFMKIDLFKVLQFWEIFRRSPSEAVPSCEPLFNVDTNGRLVKRSTHIWERRKNLTGIHFRVGVLTQGLMLRKDSKVISQFGLFLIFKSFYYKEIAVYT